MLGYQKNYVAAKELLNVMSQKFLIMEKSKQKTLEDLKYKQCGYDPHMEFLIT